MKRFYAVIAALTLSLSVGVTAMAQGKLAGKGSRKAGCSSCRMAGATPEQIKKFKADSIDLRQEMMNKRFDLQRENLKESPDSARIAAIKAEMGANRVKIDALKSASNLPESASCCMEDCPLMDGDCYKCSKTADCCSKNCNKNSGCDKCWKASDCGCSKKGKGAAK